MKFSNRNQQLINMLIENQFRRTLEVTEILESFMLILFFVLIENQTDGRVAA